MGWPGWDAALRHILPPTPPRIRDTGWDNPFPSWIALPSSSSSSFPGGGGGSCANPRAPGKACGFPGSGQRLRTSCSARKLPGQPRDSQQDSPPPHLGQKSLTQSKRPMGNTQELRASTSSQIFQEDQRVPGLWMKKFPKKGQAGRAGWELMVPQLLGFLQEWEKDPPHCTWKDPPAPRMVWDECKGS